MTAPAISVETVEQLDLTPVCEGRVHEGSQAVPAQLWVYMHDCWSGALCIPCHREHAVWFAEMRAAGKVIECSWCRVVFASWSALITKVVPL